MVRDLKKRYDIILSHEAAVARSVALATIKPKQFSVWEVLIPIIFIFVYMKSKESREVFAQNIMFTKKMALQAAYEMLKKNQSRESAVDRIKAKTQDMITSVPGGIYSEEIRQAQLNEIDLLVDHYGILLNSEGDSFEELAFNAYRTPDRLTDFFQLLQKAEKRVGHAACRTLGSNADTGSLERMNFALEKSRQKITEIIFSTRPPA